MSSTTTDLPHTCPICGCSMKTTFSRHERSPLISELLRCNDPSSDVDLSDFQNTVRSGPRCLADLDEKIAQAKEHLKTLIRQRSVLETNIDDARTLSSPIRRIPSDVVRAIVLETIPSSYEVMNSTVQRNSLDNSESPWTLAQVSHRWRLAIVKAPEVWSSMSLVINHDEKTPLVARQMFMTGVRLERSHRFPLTVSLSSCADVDISNHPLIFLISSRCSSIRNLRIDTSLISYPAFSWWRGRLDQLCHLAFTTPFPLSSGPLSSGGEESVIDAFEYAPKLKTVTMRACDRFHFSFRFPWTQIVHLSLSIFDGNDIGTLRQLKNLNSLHIAYEMSGLAVPAGHRPILISTLTSLTLTDLYVRAGPLPWPWHSRPRNVQIFSLLSIPNLTYLRLVSYGEFNMFPTIPALNAITTLKLEFGGTAMSSMSADSDNEDILPELLTLLKSVSDLQHLIISSSSTTPSPYVVSPLVSLLVRMSLPHLRTLDLRGAVITCNHARFVEMIKDRSRHPEMDQMETLYLHSPLTLGAVHARMLQNLIDGGLKVVYGE
ncbi:uncharacterized protein EV420DRAFT_504421 [Desarmillaria tabescens]|uniref:F-box domain-containing protein n=1 Tax=Armillaria tabescens TaxID=1929756 RepID=A0AA39N4Y0_ARMTA|nr:uncharacterized protein EV420DRAFT_504421 [Desarmillaria tabescens]KAK0457608.1 hypothetical protein EV420DRAFT_504421 [Desarmillaria tabescens]